MKMWKSVSLILLLNTLSYSLEVPNTTETNNSTDILRSSKTPPDNLTTTNMIAETTSTNIPCEKNSNPCQISEGFICQDGFCKCAYPNLTYDPGTQKCFARVSQQCGFFIGLKNASIVACPENAICALLNMEMETDENNNQYSAHQCACIYTHYKNKEGNCVPLAKHGENCDNHRKCNVESDLICHNGTCQCKFMNDQFFDPERDACISYADGNCTRTCVANSVCDFYSGTCQCRLDHRINEERFCEPIPPGYLAPCLGEQELCNSEIGLKCIDKICQCANPLHQTFDWNKCIGFAGDICDPSLTDNCVKDAVCVKSSNDSDNYQCQCIEGFSTTPFRKCMKSYKQKCSNEFCNVFRGLACINGECSCFDSFLNYNETVKACLSTVGSPCGKIFVPFPGDSWKNSCVECTSYYFACDSSSTCLRDFSQGTEVEALEKFRCQAKPKQTNVL